MGKEDITMDSSNNNDGEGGRNRAKRLLGGSPLSRGLGRGKSKRGQSLEVMEIPNTTYTDPPVPPRPTLSPGSTAGSSRGLIPKKEPSFRQLVAASQAGVFSGTGSRPTLISGSTSGSGRDLSQNRERSFPQLVAASNTGVFSADGRNIPSQQSPTAAEGGSTKNAELAANGSPPSQQTVAESETSNYDNVKIGRDVAEPLVGAIPSTGNLPQKSKVHTRTGHTINTLYASEKVSNENSVREPGNMIGAPGKNLPVGAIPSKGGQQQPSKGIRRNVKTPTPASKSDGNSMQLDQESVSVGAFPSKGGQQRPSKGIRRTVATPMPASNTDGKSMEPGQGSITIGAVPSTGGHQNPSKGIRRTVTTPTPALTEKNERLLVEPNREHFAVGVSPSTEGLQQSKKGISRTVAKLASPNSNSDGPSLKSNRGHAVIGAIPSTQGLQETSKGSRRTSIALMPNMDGSQASEPGMRPIASAEPSETGSRKDGNAATTADATAPTPNNQIISEVDEIPSPPSGIHRAVSHQVGTTHLTNSASTDAMPSLQRTVTSPVPRVGAVSSDHFASHPAQRKAGLHDHSDPGASVGKTANQVGAVAMNTSAPDPSHRKAGLRDHSGGRVSVRRASNIQVGAVTATSPPIQKGLRKPQGSHEMSSPDREVGAISSHSAETRKGLRQSSHRIISTLNDSLDDSSMNQRQSTLDESIGAISSHSAPARKGLRQSSHRSSNTTSDTLGDSSSSQPGPSSLQNPGRETCKGYGNGRLRLQDSSNSYRSVRDESLSEYSSAAEKFCTFQDVSLEGVEGSLSLDPMWLTFSPKNLSGSNILQSRSWKWSSISKRFVKERMNVMKIVFDQEEAKSGGKPKHSILLHLNSHEELKRLMKETSRRLRVFNDVTEDAFDYGKSKEKEKRRHDGLLTSAVADLSAETVWEDEDTGPRSEQYKEQPGDEQLVRAYAVEEEDIPILPSAEEFDEEQQALAAKERQRKSRSRMMICLCVGILTIFIAVGSYVAAEDNKEAVVVVNNTQAPTVSPSAAPTMEGNRILDLLPDYTVESVLVGCNPQSQAFDWLKNDTSWNNYTDARLLQRFVLATLYYAWNGDEWWSRYLDGLDWLSSKHHECDWAISNNLTRGLIFDREGIDYYLTPSTPCELSEDGERLYTHLWLAALDLTGTIPREMYLLTNLEFLNIRDNRNLHGEISTEIGMLTALKAASFAFTAMTGTLPKELMLCSNLEALILEQVEPTFEGTIPTEIGLLTKLQHFWIQSSGLNSTIPTEFGLLKELNTLFIKMGGLHGTIPSELGVMSSIRDVDLAFNSLTGSLPSEFGNLRTLIALQTSYNHISGLIPSEIGLLSNLRTLSLAGNELTGSLPSEIGGLASIELLSLRYNYLNGSLPSEIGQLRFPVNDSLSGSTGAGLAPSLLTMSENLFSGSIPSELGLLGDLGLLDLFYNYFSGAIPTEIGMLNYLLDLYLDVNFLSGSIPSELGQLYTYAVLLDWNYLNGSLPSELGNLFDLDAFGVSNNMITGSIPLEITWIPRLAHINLANNQLTGEVPVFGAVVNGWFFNNSALAFIGLNGFGLGSVYNISGNSFSGTIPYELCALDGNEFEFDCGAGLCGCWCLCLQLSGGRDEEQATDPPGLPAAEAGNDDYWAAPLENEEKTTQPEDGNHYWDTPPVERGNTTIEVENDYWTATP